MENTAEVRACFTGCNIKSGKTVMQFELDPEHKGALPQLAVMTGTFVTLKLTSDQTVMFVDAASGEVLDGQEEAFPEDDCFSGVMPELPEPSYEWEDVDHEAA